MVNITSERDSRLDIFRGIPDRDLRSEGIMIVEGRFCVERCLAAGFDVMAILCEQGRHGELAALNGRAPVYCVESDVMRRIAGYDFHRGVMASARRPAAAPLDGFLASVPAGAPLGIACVDRSASGENLGSIIRSAHAFGYHAVVAAGSADIFGRRVIRVSAGSVFSIPVFEADDMGEALRALRGAGCRLVAAVTDPGSVPLGSCAVPRRVAVLFGSEGSGLPDDLTGLCDEAVHVPMIDAIDSLNLAVAAGIILHRFRPG